MSVAIAIPAYNNSATLGQAIGSLLDFPAEEIVVIDDCSTDETRSVAEREGARVVRQEVNRGRGAARAEAMANTTAPLVLMCDATLTLPADFLGLALPYFAHARVAAVFGHVRQGRPRTVADRWRGRHLFKAEPAPLKRDALLATGSCVLRRAAVAAVGGFNPALRSGEDAELGRRLLAAGWEVVAAPELYATCLRADSAHEALARYARWNSPAGMSLWPFLRQCAYALKVMAVADLRAGDPLAALLSLASPFYQLWPR